MNPEKPSYYRRKAEERKAYQRNYYRKRRHRIARQRELREELAPEKIVAEKAYQKAYYERNRDVLLAKRRERYRKLVETGVIVRKKKRIAGSGAS